MRLFLKNLTSFLLIILLLPLVVTMCIHGVGSMDINAEETDSFEFYLPALVAGSIQKDYPMETLKAQAVILRTILRKTGEIEARKAIQRSQLTTQEEWTDEISLAVKQTQGEVLYYQNELARPAFHALSAGRTRNTDKDYLQAVDSDVDKSCLLYYSIVRVKEPRKELTILQRDSSGYVLKLKFGSETLSGEAFRERYQLNSSNFSVEKKEKPWTLKTRGIGHGIGMSQYGASCMAEEGKTYREILKYYFPDIEIRDYYE